MYIKKEGLKVLIHNIVKHLHLLGGRKTFKAGQSGHKS